MAKLRILEPSAAVRLEMRPLRAASRFGPIRTRVNGVSVKTRRLSGNSHRINFLISVCGYTYIR